MQSEMSRREWKFLIKWFPEKLISLVCNFFFPKWSKNPESFTYYIPYYSFAYCSEDHSQINVDAGVYLIYCYAN